MFSNEQLEEMSKEAEAIAELMKATEKFLKEKEETTNDKEISQGEKDNVVHVDFSLKREYEKAKTLPLQLPQILAIYHDWAFRTHELAKINEPNLDNKAVREMIELNHNIVCTITNVLPQTENEN